jgi:quinol monooxygenase YgiN
MLYVMAVIRFRPEHGEAVCRALKALAAQSRSESGCLRYEVFQRSDEPVLVTQETWRDAAAMAGHMAGPNVAAAFGAVGSLLAAPPEIHQYTQLA